MFICPLCPERAPSKNKSLYDQHWTSNHSRMLKPYKCSWKGCTDIFHLIRQLYTHILQQHKLDGKVSCSYLVVTKTYTNTLFLPCYYYQNDNPCPLCSKKEMYTKEALYKHLLSIHKKVQLNIGKGTFFLKLASLSLLTNDPTHYYQSCNFKFTTRYSFCRYLKMITLWYT